MHIQSICSYLCTALLWITAFSATPAIANERWFQVELVLFKNLGNQGTLQEQWPSQPNLTLAENARTLEKNRLYTLAESLPLDQEGNLIASKNQLTGLTLLNSNHFQLKNHANALASSPRYKLLYHEVWNAPLPNQQNRFPIKITAGRQFGKHAELEGYIELFVEQYLHFSTHLSLTDYQISNNPFERDTRSNPSIFKEAGTSISSEMDVLTETPPFVITDGTHYYTATQSALLKESRRMRSKHIHYLDHPKFGVLILITPIRVQP